MTATPLPPLPEIDDAQCIPYQSVRYVAGFTKDFVKQYAQAYATQARADLEAENARLWHYVRHSLALGEEGMKARFALKGTP